MLVYIDAAERVLEADLEELVAGEAPSAAAAAARSEAATQVYSYEGAHPSPPEIALPGARWADID